MNINKILNTEVKNKEEAKVLYDNCLTLITKTTDRETMNKILMVADKCYRIINNRITYHSENGSVSLYEESK